MNQKYPFVKCLNPRVIFNPYTQERLVVSCGNCPACSLRKSSMNALKCKLESMSHKYCMFVTLTYNNVSLPRMMVKCVNRYIDIESDDVIDTYEHDNVIDITTRLGTQGTFLGHYNNFTMSRYILPKKCNLPRGILPRLHKYDAQLFIKRLRRNLDKIFKNEAEKIRYYLVGEYGPRHFRPHYHFMLWFSKDETYKVIRQAIHQSWSFGRVDIQKSLGKCADYVAKYLNSSVPLPQVFKFQQTRPFAIHSTHLGEKVLEIAREEIYKQDYRTAVTRIIPSITGDSELVLWRSLKTFYFPKCKGFAEKSKYERLYSYQVYEHARCWTQETCMVKQARIITSTLLSLHYKTFRICTENLDYQLIEYFQKSLRMDLYNVPREECRDYYEFMFRAIYMELRTSKHMIDFVCQGDVNLLPNCIDMVESFWQKDDLHNLNAQLADMEEFGLSDWYTSPDDYVYFYFNKGFDVVKFKTSKAFKSYHISSTHNLANSVKHKELNDLNNIFANK